VLQHLSYNKFVPAEEEAAGPEMLLALLAFFDSKGLLY
jgi:hypothetical protein